VIMLSEEREKRAADVVLQRDDFKVYGESVDIIGRLNCSCGGIKGSWLLDLTVVR